MQHQNGISRSNHHIDERHLEPTDTTLRYGHEIDVADKAGLMLNEKMHSQLNKNSLPEFSFDPSRLVLYLYFC